MEKHLQQNQYHINAKLRKSVYFVDNFNSYIMVLIDREKLFLEIKNRLSDLKFSDKALHDMTLMDILPIYQRFSTLTDSDLSVKILLMKSKSENIYFLEIL